MLHANSKVHHLFHGMSEVLAHKKDFDVYADILRNIINDKIVSGKLYLIYFFTEKNTNIWMKYVETKYGEDKASEFYSILLDIPRTFDIVSSDTKKQQWFNMMTPIVQSVVSSAIPSEELLNVVWQAIAHDETEKVKKIFEVGQLLYK